MPQKPIFLKHIEAEFYSPLVFSISQFLVSLPFVAIDATVFGNMIYWMCGLANYSSTYLMFLALVISYGVAMNSMMSVFPFLASTEDASLVMAVFILILSMVVSGVVATPNIIPVALKWMYWINPLAWIYRALAINEYHSGDYEMIPCKFTIQGHKLSINQKCGDYFLESRQISTDDNFIWQALAVVGAYTVFFLGFTVVAISWIRFDEDRAEKTDEEEAILEAANEAFLDAVSPGHGQAVPLQRRDSVSTSKKRLAVRDLWYSIPIQGVDIDFLKGVSFWIQPGSYDGLDGEFRGRQDHVDGRDGW